MPRPHGISASQLPDDAMLKMCIDNNKEDHSFDAPVHNPQGVKVKITPTACILSDKQPPGMTPANAFMGYTQ
jgi:hypothetical protein